MITRYFAGSMEVRPSIARNARSSLPAPPRGSTICRVIEPRVYYQRGMRLDLYLGRCAYNLVRMRNLAPT
jgi:hypothetical protein